MSARREQEIIPGVFAEALAQAQQCPSALENEGDPDKRKLPSAPHIGHRDARGHGPSQAEGSTADLSAPPAEQTRVESSKARLVQPQAAHHITSTTSFLQMEKRDWEGHQVPGAGSAAGWDGPRGPTRMPSCPAKLHLVSTCCYHPLGPLQALPQQNAARGPKKYYQEFILFVSCQTSEALQVTLCI